VVAVVRAISLARCCEFRSWKRLPVLGRANALVERESDRLERGLSNVARQVVRQVRYELEDLGAQHVEGDSEVGRYLRADQLDRLADQLLEARRPVGVIGVEAVPKPAPELGQRLRRDAFGL
jgi:hypothetical protein